MSKSSFCQFCDKEMSFKESIVFVNDYVTCGAGKCKQKAQKAHNAILTDAVIKDKEQRAKESKETQGGMVPELVVVFRTQTPEDKDSWRITKPEDHPYFMRDPDVMQRMVEEGMAATDSDNPGLWYLAKALSEVSNAVESVKQRAH